EGRSVSQLLRCPPLAWLAGDGDVDHLLRVHVHDEEREDGPEPNIVHLKEIAGPDRMVVEEDAPLLPIARWAYRADVPLDRSLRHSQSQLQQSSAVLLGCVQHPKRGCPGPSAERAQWSPEKCEARNVSPISSAVSRTAGSLRGASAGRFRVSPGAECCASC